MTEPIGDERRIGKRADAKRWCDIETSVESPAGLSLGSVWYSAFPGETSGPPTRQRWVTTAVRGHNLMAGGVQLDPKREWALSLHNKHAHERAGSLLIFDPDEIAAARVEGTYGVAVRLTPTPGRKSIHVAVSYFLQQPYPDANAAFLKSAPRSLERLRKTGWAADVRRVDAAWQVEMDQIAEPLRRLGARHKVRERIDELASAYAKALAEARTRRRQGQPPGRRLERRLGQLLDHLHAARQDVFATAVEALLEEDE